MSFQDFLNGRHNDFSSLPLSTSQTNQKTSSQTKEKQLENTSEEL